MVNSWSVTCRDSAGRRRLLRIRVDGDGQVVIITPPGEAAVLDVRDGRGADRVQRTIDALSAAREAAVLPGRVVWLRPDGGDRRGEP